MVVAEREFAASVEALIAYRACRAFLQRAGVPIYSIFDLSSPAMGNQANLMSSFEFIAALMSIIIGLGVTNLLRWSRARVLSPERKSARRSPYCLHCRDFTAASFAVVGHIQMEHRSELDF